MKLSDRMSGLAINHISRTLGPIVKEPEETLIPIWCLNDSVVEALVRAHPYFADKGPDDVEKAVDFVLERARLQRIADANVLKRYGRVPRER